MILPDEAAVAGVDIRGGGTGTREIELLRPEATVGAVNAIVLSGGSAFGLAAADGAMAWLAEHGRGFAIAGSVVPIVPAAILFDLANGGDKDWGAKGRGGEPPYRDLGYRAAASAGADFAIGNAGAGYGAKAGGLKGGLGTASTVLEDGATVGALAAVNAHGSVLMPGSDVFWAWLFERDGEFGGRRPSGSAAEPAPSSTSSPGENTTLVVVATDCALTKAEATRLATMAQDGLARAIRPAHTPLDGDIVFALSTGKRPRGHLSQLGSEAADCVARAIARAVYAAEDLGSLRSYRSLSG